MTEHDPAGAAKEAAAAEAARQIVSTIGLVAFSVLAVYLQRHAADPDFARTLRMRAARTAEGRLARLGIWALTQAERQRQAYEGMTHGH
jgi:hypothetical protein